MKVLLNTKTKGRASNLMLGCVKLLKWFSESGEYWK